MKSRSQPLFTRFIYSLFIVTVFVSSKNSHAMSSFTCMNEQDPTTLIWVDRDAENPMRANLIFVGTTLNRHFQAELFNARAECIQQYQYKCSIPVETLDNAKFTSSAIHGQWFELFPDYGGYKVRVVRASGARGKDWWFKGCSYFR